MQFTMLALPFLFSADPERLDLRGGWAVVQDGVVKEVHWDAPPAPVPPKPEEWTVPDGFTRYASAKFTQEIAITNGRHRISPVPRSRLEAKWQVPGGLVGVSGWTSELYTNTPPGGRGTYQQDWVPVLNSFGYFQRNLGYVRQYNDGIAFLDVLRNRDGRVFEVRRADKSAGKWTRSVGYRDYTARPAGYHPVSTTECAACHNQAGTGGYAAGLVPGGDTILSEPLPGLETQEEPQAALQNLPPPADAPATAAPPVFVRQFAPRGRSGGC